MFVIDEDKTIRLTRGDIASIDIEAVNQDGDSYTFKNGDVIRFKVTERKNCENIKLCKDIIVQSDTTTVNLSLSSDDTKLDDLINKPTKYWYEVELNPDSQPQTIIGYDQDGEKLLILYPEGSDAC